MVAVVWRGRALLFGVAAVEAHNILYTACSTADCWGRGRRIAPLEALCVRILVHLVGRCCLPAHRVCHSVPS
ncbi:hypothetical protein INR49_002066 [Caranx melampygus]|nr:hypothetical protein INR49_002066 [Caranx melampygus]